MILTGFGRSMRMTERSAAQLPRTAEVLELDVNSPQDLERRRAELDARWGALDGVLHAIAYAPPDALGGGFLDTPAQSAAIGVPDERVLAEGAGGRAAPLLEAAPDGAGVVGLDFDAGVAWPSYDWMGVAKAALEAVARYLARELGPREIRVNLVSAGPIETLAAGGIPGFDELAELWSADRAARLGHAGPRPRGGRGLLPALAAGAQDHRRDPARRRRLSRDGLSLDPPAPALSADGA